MTTFVQFHLLTVYPPSNPNRDDTGRPKQALVGGAPRLRLSSQSLKRAIRESAYFESDLAGHKGTRTKRLGIELQKRLIEQGETEDKAREIANAVATVFSKLEAPEKGKPQEPVTTTLAFISPDEWKLAEELAERMRKGESLPIDTYKRDLDAVCQEPLHLDWEGLRADIVQHGLRNSTLTALMPSETSSQIANATNGIEPPRGLVSVKASKDGILKQVVPEFERLKNQYELLWQMPNNDGYLKLVGVMQKFVDQAISSNTSYDPQRFEGGRVPMKQLLKDLLTAYKFGLKTLYYHNTRDGADDTQADLQDDGCAGGACKI